MSLSSGIPPSNGNRPAYANAEGEDSPPTASFTGTRTRPGPGARSCLGTTASRSTSEGLASSSDETHVMLRQMRASASRGTHAGNKCSVKCGTAPVIEITSPGAPVGNTPGPLPRSRKQIRRGLGPHGHSKARSCATTVGPPRCRCQGTFLSFWYHSVWRYHAAIPASSGSAWGWQLWAWFSPKPVASGLGKCVLPISVETTASDNHILEYMARASQFLITCWHLEGFNLSRSSPLCMQKLFRKSCNL